MPGEKDSRELGPKASVSLTRLLFDGMSRGEGELRQTLRPVEPSLREEGFRAGWDKARTAVRDYKARNLPRYGSRNLRLPQQAIGAAAVGLGEGLWAPEGEAPWLYGIGAGGGALLGGAAGHAAGDLAGGAAGRGAQKILDGAASRISHVPTRAVLRAVREWVPSLGTLVGAGAGGVYGGVRGVRAGEAAASKINKKLKAQEKDADMNKEAAVDLWNPNTGEVQGNGGTRALNQGIALNKKPVKVEAPKKKQYTMADLQKARSQMRSGGFKMAAADPTALRAMQREAFKPAETRVYDSVKWHADSPTAQSTEAAKLHLLMLMRWLRDKRLLSAVGAGAFSSNQIPDDFELTGKLLTPEGRTLFNKAYREWVSKIIYGQRPSMDILEDALHGGEKKAYEAGIDGALAAYGVKDAALAAGARTLGKGMQLGGKALGFLPTGIGNLAGAAVGGVGGAIAGAASAPPGQRLRQATIGATSGAVGGALPMGIGFIADPLVNMGLNKMAAINPTIAKRLALTSAGSSLLGAATGALAADEGDRGSGALRGGLAGAALGAAGHGAGAHLAKKSLQRRGVPDAAGIGALLASGAGVLGAPVAGALAGRSAKEEEPFAVRTAALNPKVLQAAQAFGKTLRTNPYARNAAIGAGFGAVGGVLGAKEGKGGSGALKGALGGAAVGAGGTLAHKKIRAYQAQPRPGQQLGFGF